MDARAVAVKVLVRVVGQGESLSTALPAERHKAGVDASLVQELCYGTLRWYIRLSAILQGLLRKPLGRSNQDVDCLLMLGLYQLLYTRIPPHAAVHRTVQVVKLLNKVWAKGLVNGVLRNVLRQKVSLLAKLDDDPITRFSHPSWLLERLRSAHPGHWQEICEAANQRPPMTLRISRRLSDVGDYIERLNATGTGADRHAVVEGAVVLRRAVPVERLPGFAEGAATVQDAAAQLAAPLLDCRPGMRILDACAAPGGKTAHMLELVDGDAEMLALDMDSQRLTRLRQTLDRLGWEAKIRQGDVLRPQLWWDGGVFDRILLDAPCSATGVIRRHPDIKLLRKSKDIISLRSKQYRMLQSLWPLLATGGRLLYVTCSILPEENAQQMEKFVRNNEGAQLIPLGQSGGANEGWQIFPGEKNMDGFYFSLLHKRS
ncbi:MAG: 16S rRNA (cytosine(967)-C(5))-methyltransferase RsmB [Gammaproteobacteria bacterium]|nr:16S rRNA (cytosine(967)-C(5))-methyltransferase RsmB [Gammaproteobacteria bacterium]